jgi:hypothetical protein
VLPPELPPADADPIVWTLARQVWIDHQAGVDGQCPLCREPWPCGPAGSAGIAIELGARCGWLLPDRSVADDDPTGPETGTSAGDQGA